MNLVAFVLEEKGKPAAGTTLRVDAGQGSDPFTRAAEEMASRGDLADPETRQMIAGHFAEVALAKVLAGDDAAAGQAANALLLVMEQPYLLVRANRLRGDLEITEVTAVQASGDAEAEAVLEATLERLAGNPPEH